VERTTRVVAGVANRLTCAGWRARASLPRLRDAGGRSSPHGARWVFVTAQGTSVSLEPVWRIARPSSLVAGVGARVPPSPVDCGERSTATPGRQRGRAVDSFRNGRFQDFKEMRKGVRSCAPRASSDKTRERRLSRMGHCVMVGSGRRVPGFGQERKLIRSRNALLSLFVGIGAA
jgi:hypothetical protein